jgi:Dynamin family
MNLLREAQSIVRAALQFSTSDVVRSRLQEEDLRLAAPLRVALIGRAKAGKSTLLNALVGDLVAPTDAAECTMLPTEYHSGFGYRAWKVDLHGDLQPARFTKDDDGAHIELDGTPVTELARLLVEFPSPYLDAMTLVDTPGLGSANTMVSQRTVAFTSDAEPAPADAIVYLLRSWHAVDSDFLAAFHDRIGVDVPPVNAIGVLSRADEVAGGGTDALAQAQLLAQALAEDPTLSTLLTTVLPVAGLLAETATILTEGDYRVLARLLEHGENEVREALLSVERFVSADRLTQVAATDRRRLLARFGLFGMRHALTEMAAGRIRSSSELCAELTLTSGLEAVRTLIFGQLSSRAATMRASNALDLVDAMLSDERLRWNEDLASDLERVQINAFEIDELRALNDLVCSVSAVVPAGDRSRAAALLGAHGPDIRSRLGLPAVEASEAVRSRMLDELAFWQSRATSSAQLPDEQRLARTIVRSLTNIAAETLT